MHKVFEKIRKTKQKQNYPSNLEKSTYYIFRSITGCIKYKQGKNTEFNLINIKF